MLFEKITVGDLKTAKFNIYEIEDFFITFEINANKLFSAFDHGKYGKRKIWHNWSLKDINDAYKANVLTIIK